MDIMSKRVSYDRSRKESISRNSCISNNEMKEITD